MVPCSSTFASRTSSSALRLIRRRVPCRTLRLPLPDISCRAARAGQAASCCYGCGSSIRGQTCRKLATSSVRLRSWPCSRKERGRDWRVGVQFRALEPANGEMVVSKRDPSASSTDVNIRLQLSGVDALVVCRASTSGCVRVSPVMQRARPPLPIAESAFNNTVKT
jgi:hypothetical protein